MTAGVRDVGRHDSRGVASGMPVGMIRWRSPGGLNLLLILFMIGSVALISSRP